MSSDRALKAAYLVNAHDAAAREEAGEPVAEWDLTVLADLIDRAAGLPELEVDCEKLRKVARDAVVEQGQLGTRNAALEARVAELERVVTHDAQQRWLIVERERDALARRIEAAVATLEAWMRGKEHGTVQGALRTLRGDAEAPEGEE